MLAAKRNGPYLTIVPMATTTYKQLWLRGVATLGLKRNSCPR